MGGGANCKISFDSLTPSLGPLTNICKVWFINIKSVQDPQYTTMLLSSGEIDLQLFGLALCQADKHMTYSLFLPKFYPIFPLLYTRKHKGVQYIIYIHFQ